MTGDEVNLRLIGRRVDDAEGRALGSLSGTYVDAASGELLFGVVRMLRRGRRKLVVISLLDASIDAERVQVTCGRELARRGPSLRPGHELAASEEEALFAYYDVPHTPGTAYRRLRPAETS